MRRTAVFLIAGSLGLAADVNAFPHVVQPGESLAAISEHMYGTSKVEAILAGVNALDVQGGSAVVPGMRLEIPAPWHHRVAIGETWPGLARAYLGDGDRADTLARMNGASAWIAPAADTYVRIPFVMTVIASSGEKTTDIAQRFFSDPNRAWEIHNFNGITKAQLTRGQVILIPLTDLTLTDLGIAEANKATAFEHSQADGSILDSQRKVAAELPELLSDLRAGRYVEAVARGNRMTGGPLLSKAQLGTIYRALTTAYVALDSKALAAASCAMWKTNDVSALTLDPIMVSPKIRAVCK